MEETIRQAAHDALDQILLQYESRGLDFSLFDVAVLGLQVEEDGEMLTETYTKVGVELITTKDSKVSVEERYVVQETFGNGISKLKVRENWQ